MLVVFFTIVYFRCFVFVLNLFFSHDSFNVLAEIYNVVSWVIVFIVSVGLAELTKKKMVQWYSDPSNADKIERGNFPITVIFIIVYFLYLLHVIAVIFDHIPWTTLTDILALVCFVIAFIASVGLAEFTEKKIAEKYRQE